MAKELHGAETETATETEGGTLETCKVQLIPASLPELLLLLLLW